MEAVEVNINGRPLEDVEMVDFDAVKGCFLIHMKDGQIIEAYFQ